MGLENGRCDLYLRYMEVYPNLRLYLFLRSNLAANLVMRGVFRERMTQKAHSSVTVMWTTLQGEIIHRPFDSSVGRQKDNLIH